MGESTVDSRPSTAPESRGSGGGRPGGPDCQLRAVDCGLSTVDRLWRAILVLTLAATACTQRGSAPAAAIDSYAAAIARKDYGTAYGLLSSAYRQKVALADFKREQERDAAELVADARSLRGSADRWSQKVVVPLPAADPISLTREGGGWRLDGPPIEAYGQSTPRAALRAFTRAVENRRYDVLVRLAPARFRAALTAEKLRAFWEGAATAQNRAFLRELRLNLYARIAEEGEEAFMTYGSGRQVRFVREEGLWRIESPE
jgi:hypothetical protein